MYDNVCLCVAFGLGNRSPGEDGDFRDGGGGEHLMEDGRADEACCSCEDEMHLAGNGSIVLELFIAAEGGDL